MEGIGQIIFLLLIAVITIVQQVLKKRNQAAQKQSNNKPVVPDWDFEEYEEESPSIRTLEEEYRIEKPEYQFHGIESSLESAAKYKDAPNQPFTSYKEEKVPANSKKGKISQNNILEETFDEPVSPDFDLRKAVIYSEILKPKFNDEV